MKAQADGDDGKEFDQGKGEQVPIIELMRQCWLGGWLVAGDNGADVWSEWWIGHGKKLMNGYHQDTYVAKPGLREVMRVSNEIHRLVTANHAGIAHMLEAMQEMEPDDTVNPEGEVFTVTAETHDGISLVRTVRCLTMSKAIAVATDAWGHGGWETLRKRGVATD